MHKSVEELKTLEVDSEIQTCIYCIFYKIQKQEISIKVHIKTLIQSRERLIESNCILLTLLYF